MRAYLEYKDSGVEWIGEIPKHWGVRRLAALGTFSKGKGPKKDDVKSSGLPCIRYGEIYTKYDRVVYYPISFIDEATSLNTTLSFSQEVICSGDLQLHAPHWPEANKPHGKRLSHANREEGLCEDILVDKVVLTQSFTGLTVAI